MEELEPMDFFSETDRLAIVQQLRMREAASRNIADYLHAMREQLVSRGNGPDCRRRIGELERGIANTVAKAQQTAQEISNWERAL